MIDLRLLRDEQSREAIKKSENNRFKDSTVVDTVAGLDSQKRELLIEMEGTNREINSNQKLIAAAIKNRTKNEDAKEIAMQFLRTDLSDKTDRLSKEIARLDEEISTLLHSIGNVIENDVPVCKTEDGNVILRTFNDEGCVIKKTPFNELMASFTNADAGSAVMGHRGFYLEGKMAMLATALKFYALRFLTKKGYTQVQTPVMMRKSVMKETAQLSEFDEQLYKVEDDLYLIATSEQPLTALYANKHLVDSDLPKYIAGESLCFRKEAGAYGKDNAGIFRVHQFEKIEQFVICKPEDSSAMHDKLISTAEEFYQSLNLPYRVVNIASGELNDAAAKKYDLEAWFPYSQKYRELVSCSNCTDYQSRNLCVYYGFSSDKQKPAFVHMLNGTLCAVQRALCCIVENYQEDGVIKVPDVLKEFVDFDEI